MEKLIDLLTEWKPEYIWLSMNFESNTNKAYLISKSCGFIKWLVENEKIDTDIVYKKGFLAKTYDKDEVGEYFEPYEEILMLLAIQDEPIEFLVSILK